MALFLSADIHQGDERFSVHSRGKQCAFMSLSALLTARNIPLNSWSRITFKNALLQGDKMFLNALGPVVRKVYSAIHRIVIFSTVVKMLEKL